MLKLSNLANIIFSFLLLMREVASEELASDSQHGYAELYAKQGRTSQLQFLVDIFQKKDFLTSAFLQKKDAKQMMSEKYIVRDPADVAPEQRAKIFEKLDRVSMNAHIFARLFQKCDPKDLFPKKACYTIFMPYNTALSPRMLDILNRLSRADLCFFLSFFVVPADIKLTETINTKEYVTIAGVPVTVKKDKAHPTAFYVGSAEILMPFLLSSEGVTVHIIDQVAYIDAVNQFFEAEKEKNKKNSYGP